MWAETDEIEAIARSGGIDLANFQILDAPNSSASAAKSVELVRIGKTELLMKGSLHTDELMSAIVSRDGGLRTGRRISHVFFMDVPTYHKVLIITDGAINIAPTLEDKVDICQNAIDLAVSLGLKNQSRNPCGCRNSHLEDAGHNRCRGTLQDGRTRANQGRNPGWTAGV